MHNAHLRSVESRAPDPRLTSRMLVTPDRPALEFLEARPEGQASGAPLLFLHGAFAGAWTWAEIFMPLFARRGRRVAAVSLRGHGGSEGHEDLRLATLVDYVADARRAFAEFDEPPVVIAHSLGGLLGQMLIGQEEMRGLALLASLPPEGLMLESPRLALTDPLNPAHGRLSRRHASHGPRHGPFHDARHRRRRDCAPGARLARGARPLAMVRRSVGVENLRNESPERITASS